MQVRREAALHKHTTAGWSPAPDPGNSCPRAPGGRVSQPRQRGRQGTATPPRGTGHLTGGRRESSAGSGSVSPEGGREGGEVPGPAAHLVLQDADVALQEAGPDGQSRVALAAFRRAAGHRRHLLLPPPRLRVAPADADAAVHEQQAGAHGGERQADGQPVALRGAEREPAQRAPPAAGPSGARRSPAGAPASFTRQTPGRSARREVGKPLRPSPAPSPARSRASLPLPQPCFLASSPLRAPGYPAPLIPVPPFPFGHLIPAF